MEESYMISYQTQLQSVLIEPKSLGYLFGYHNKRMIYN